MLGAMAAIPEASGDACKLLTPAQVSGVLGVQVDEGTYKLSRTFANLCVERT